MDTLPATNTSILPVCTTSGCLGLFWGEVGVVFVAVGGVFWGGAVCGSTLRSLPPLFHSEEGP